MIKVGIIGASGSMGKQVAKAVLGDDNTMLVAALDARVFGMDMGNLLEGAALGIPVTNDIDEFMGARPDVVVDFTIAAAAKINVPKVLQKGIAVVIGTTGLNEEDILGFEQVAKDHNTAVFIAPNFAIGGVLMMKFAKEAIKYMPHVEVIELHHDQKLDAPSGTAMKTVELMAEERSPMVQGLENEIEKLEGARGGNYEGMRVHSVRLPGFVAHQEVIFGGLGQILTIRHDSLSRESFMPGVLLAIKEIQKYSGLVVGLDKLL